MGWYNAAYLKRIAITVDNSAAASSVDVQAVIPTDHELWDVIDETGLELRITSADGTTLLAYSVDDGAGGTFSAAAKTGRIEIDAATVAATASMALAWLYYNTTSTQGTGAVVTTIASAVTGYIERSGRPTSDVVIAGPKRPGATSSDQAIGKSVLEERLVSFDMSEWLQRSAVASEGHRKFEEVGYVEWAVYNAAAADQASMYDLTDVRFFEVGRRFYIRGNVKAGSDATAYTIAPTVYTVQPGDSSVQRKLNPRLAVSVDNALEA